ncbi:olfactory receptor family 11 subfamily A member 1 [Homo sapiens]|uniref:Olfactory receptor 11A1 n=2 Tax=Homo sapiens TaxID=9606 RepID=O11A1_HUMAN|nr:olfactory receptor 11A1 [Homo sapiens]NP_001381758.1 olfactory receptor 11A1 [Homo sapiens]NP_039225.1 olfactory receptor 11A1 [Homo sapiens]Q9GZK7.1 RecName: Full=Olfactory receptor 11A1; AltName: Full=Hs6M1-18; AltName: Full=Olfactory receptor 11A2; AltName: Full=Olfactory receptor OR6-30 [Homo sapiens]ALI87342.1 OR11A1 [Homo sapiens]AQY76998.1 OR11A1 [Homo sapiens]EAX03192.1 hCG1748532, isoform CRA_a [Homo sapiens]EAX03193.1 hCG1748532, isoform CRA_a [Homo sapiens]KAI4017264.1 olfacto|eukprot:NP_039225.1 olfactory receptor 11A1 [Homo sapiens]
MEIVSTGNETITEFVLLGFYDIPELHFLFFIVFTAVYVFIIIGNMLIIVAVVSSQRLHKPMYIFLANLSFLDILYTSAVMPKMLEGFLQEATISVAGCLLQFFIFGSLATAECLLLAVMAYDRYLAICYPLHYPLLMGPRRYMGLVVTTWLSGFVVDGLVVALVAQLRFCGPNHIDQFYCDFMLFVGLACSDPRVAQVTTLILSVFCLTIPFGLILTSYARIVVAVLRVPAGASRRRAFSTCSSHLAVVTTFYGTLMIFYVAPSAVHSQLLSKVFSLLYTVVTPLFNPVIYTMRNKEVHQALRKILCIKQTETLD